VSINTRPLQSVVIIDFLFFSDKLYHRYGISRAEIYGDQNTDYTTGIHMTIEQCCGQRWGLIRLIVMSRPVCA